jgi:hypothetical protein
MLRPSQHLVFANRQEQARPIVFLLACVSDQSPKGRGALAALFTRARPPKGGPPVLRSRCKFGREFGVAERMPIGRTAQQVVEIRPAGLKFVAVSGWSILVLVRPIAFHIAGRGETMRACAGRDQFPSAIERRRRGYSSTPCPAFVRFAGKLCSRRRWPR